jgi:hypothetical protein
MSAADQLSLVPGLERPERAARHRPPAVVLVLATLKSNAVPMLVEEIAKAAHLPLSSVAARVGELMRRGLVLPAVYRPTRTGRGAWAWVLPELLGPERRADAKRVAELLRATRGRWTPTTPEAQNGGTLRMRAMVVEAEGGPELLGFVSEILGT